MENPTFDGKIIVFTAPSGAGKSTIVREMLNRFKNLAFSVSATTRCPRLGEVDGEHYHFLSQEDFNTKIQNQDFVEYQEVYDGVYYGTLKSELESLWQNHKHVLFDIDVEGAKKIKSIYNGKAITIFVQPPTIEELERRLVVRATDDQESIKKRIAKFSKELETLSSFDVRLVNDDLQIAFTEAENVIKNFLKQ